MSEHSFRSSFQSTLHTLDLRNNVSTPQTRALPQNAKPLPFPSDGVRSGIELTVLGKRRIQYEEELAHDPTNYDAWFSLARLEEDAYRADRDDAIEGVGSGPGRVRETYERAVANVPPAGEKR